MYSIEYSTKSKEFLKKSDNHISKRIIDRIENLKETPIPKDAKFIGRDKSDDKIFRYRVGDYRVLYKIKESNNIVLIVKIDKRSRVYS